MRSLLLCTLALLATLPAAAGAGDVEYQFLRSEGAYLHRVTLNGTTLASGSAISITLPLPVTKYLNDGRNELEVEYTSDPRVGLSVVIDSRAKGRRAEMVRFSGEPGETQGRRVTTTVAFTATVHRQPPLQFTDADRQAILEVLGAYYAALSRRDGAGLRKLYEKAMAEDGPIYPEGIGVFQWVLNDSLRMLGNPRFHMKPLQRSDLLFSIAGQVVMVTKPDQTPVVESDPVEVNGQTQPRLKPDSVLFKKYDGRWYLALPFGF